MRTRAQALLEDAAHHLEFASIALRRAATEEEFDEETDAGFRIASERFDLYASSARVLAKKKRL